MERKKKFVRQKKNPLLKSKKKIKKKKKMKRIVIMRKNKENPTIEKLLLEKNFLNSQRNCKTSFAQSITIGKISLQERIQRRSEENLQQ